MTPITSGTGTDIWRNTHPSQELLWARRFGGNDNERVKKMEFDAAGNVYIQGWSVSPTVNFGSQTVTTNGYDAYVAKADVDGNFVWARSFGGSGNEWGLGLAVDDNGNVYTGGKLEGTVDFDPNASHPGNVDILNSEGGDDAFVLKLDTNGSFQWVFGAGGAGDDITHRVTVDAAGNAYAIGLFQGTANFGAFSLNAQGGSYESFLVKLNASGTPDWVRHLSSAGEAAQVRIRSDGTSIYAVGRFTDTLSFRDENGSVLAGSPTLTSAGRAGYVHLEVGCQRQLAVGEAVQQPTEQSTVGSSGR